MEAPGVSKETVGVSPGAEYSPAPPPSESPDTAEAQSDLASPEPYRSQAEHGVQTPTDRSGGGVCLGQSYAHSRRGLPSFARNEHKQQANNMSSPPYGL